MALTASVSAHNQTAPGAGTVEAERCTPLTSPQTAWLGPEWGRFVAFARACEVKRGNSRPLYLVSVWARDFEATLPKDAPAERLPKPLIVAQDGKVLGHLPLGFPDDPPRSSDIRFTNWSNGFPHCVRIAITDPTVLGNRTLVMKWDAQSQSYVRTKPKNREPEENQ